MSEVQSMRRPAILKHFDLHFSIPSNIFLEQYLQKH